MLNVLEINVFDEGVNVNISLKSFKIVWWRVR